MDDETIQRRRWGILAVLVLCLLVVILDNTILNVALKTIQTDLDASQTDMQWAVDSYALVFAGLLITWGVLGDRLGRKKILLLGLFLFGAMSAVCSFANTSGQLIAFRALMGIGAAAIQPQTLSIIQNVFSPRERPKAIGIWAGASGAGIALGPITGGLLLKYFWWGSIFLVNVPIVAVAIIAIFLLVPDSKDPRPGKLDPLGVVLSIVSLFVLVYGVIQGGNKNQWLRWDTGGAIVVGLVLVAVFIWTQAKSSHPTIDVSLFKHRAFSSGAFAISMAFFALQGSTFFLAYYLQAIRLYTPLNAGVALVGVAAAVMTAAPLSARLSARFGPAVVCGMGLLLLGISLSLYSLVTEHTNIAFVELLLVGTGGGMGLTMSPATNAIMGAVPREKAGAGSAVNNTVRQVAGALGVAVLGSIVAVSFRAHLGTDAPSQVAAQLDRPASVVKQLPASERVGGYVSSDTSQSIADAELFAQEARAAVIARGQHSRAGSSSQSPKQVAAAKARAARILGGFFDDARSSFVSAMNLTALLGGLFALLGAFIAWRFLPNRREFETMGAPAAAPPADEAPKHLDVDAEPVPAHASHLAEHARLDASVELDGRHELVDEFGDPVEAEDAR
ncbi:MFS transporter [Jatrophihabitans endophyticus]|uniref:MFS transporter n=1 Tax=Jatrophihabitans endophyticus TaxID=1206085 RepID=UPI0019D9C24F|nr:MFS transporter [Jatrophihabitans endophyticus]MBE7187475.1 MFS transporter [Jatrophihabitans endophyticus]